MSLQYTMELPLRIEIFSIETKQVSPVSHANRIELKNETEIKSNFSRSEIMLNEDEYISRAGTGGSTVD